MLRAIRHARREDDLSSGNPHLRFSTEERRRIG